jgi:hypothetical protein
VGFGRFDRPVRGYAKGATWFPPGTAEWSGNPQISRNSRSQASVGAG